MSDQTADEKREKVKNKEHPFRAFYVGGNIGYCTYRDAKSRINHVQNMSLQQLRRALELDDLQKTVRKAVNRRIKKLENHEL